MKRQHDRSQLEHNLAGLEESVSELWDESDSQEPASEETTARIAMLIIFALNELTRQVAALNRSIFHYPEHQDDTDQQNTTPGL